MALFKINCPFLQVLDILDQSVFHVLLGLLVSKAAFGDGLEPRSTLSDQAADVLLKLLLRVDRLHIFCRLLHVSK